MKKRIYVLLIFILLISCREKNQREEEIESNNLQIFLNEVLIECNKPHKIGSKIFPYFPYQIGFKFIVKNVSEDTVLFGSHNRFRFSSEKLITTKRYGLFILKDSVDSLVFNTRLEDIQILNENDSIEISADYSDLSFFATLPHENFQNYLYKKITEGTIYYQPLPEEYAGYASNTRLVPKKTLVKIPNIFGIFFAAQGKYLEHYPP